MKLKCSRGHIIDLKNPERRRWRKKIAGDKCPIEIEYLVFGGATYCRRVLKNYFEDNKRCYVCGKGKIVNNECTNCKVCFISMTQPNQKV